MAERRRFDEQSSPLAEGQLLGRSDRRCARLPRDAIPADAQQALLDETAIVAIAVPILVIALLTSSLLVARGAERSAGGR